MKTSVMLGLGALTLLTACGTSSPLAGQGPITLPELIDRSEAFEQKYGSINPDSDLITPHITPAGAIPNSGSASYTGVALMGTAPNEANPNNPTAMAMGSAVMTANFGSGSISGSADNFFLLDGDETPDLASMSDWTGEPVEGSMTFSLERLGSDNKYEGRFEGSFTPTGQETISLDVPGGGAFLGEDLGGFMTEGHDKKGNYASIHMFAD